MNKLKWNFNQNTKLSIHKNASENIVFEMAAILSRGRWDNVWTNHGPVYWCKYGSLGLEELIINNGSGNALEWTCNKPLHEPMLTIQDDVLMA